jgi:nicotinate-nucleotide--dimethylbenzimidazole phosphoribosyltransferase
VNLPPDLDAVIVDLGGTVVIEAPPGTPVADIQVRYLPGVVDDLRALSGSVRLAAATNTAAMLEADIRALLSPAGVADLLSVIVTSCDVGAAKPDPAVLTTALDRLGGIAPERALFIGNEQVDADAAAAIGMPFAWAHPAGLLAAISAAIDDTKEDAQPGGRRWARPVPVIGDTTSAAARAAEPDGWRLDAADRAGLYRAVFARRDVRRFRPDAVDDELVHRLLAAAHAAPSVGHSQPWRFVLVRDPRTRERAALIADRERLAQAADLDPVAAQHLLDLQLEGIREAPLGVVVCCDRRAPAAGVLGRRTFPDADLWSCACAIQNLWLSARAEGLGVGWVTLFPPAELAGLLSLPAHVEPLGWLCVGWPDERSPDPGLERAGWSHRLALDDVVLHERWPDTEAPAPPPSKLRAPEPTAVVGARDEADTLLAPPTSLGVLDRTVDRIVALGRPDLDGGTLVLAVGRHPVVELGVSAYPASVTDEVLAAARAGEALGAVAAAAAGLGLVVVDAGASAGNLRDADALTVDVVDDLLSRGAGAGRAAGADGLVALGEVGIGNTTVAAALAAALLALDADAVVGLGAGSDSAMLDRKREVVAAALARAAAAHGDLRTADPRVLLAALGGPELAFLTGVALGATEAGAAVVLDGLATSVAALVATRLDPAVTSHLVAGQQSRELAHPAVLAALGLEPLLALRLRAGEGVGACFAARLVLQALYVRRHAARTG